MARQPQKRIEPRPGQESVWDYPRPPRLEACHKSVRVVIAGVTVAETTSSFRVLETSHPPTYYLPPGDIRRDLLRPAPGQSFCEWKGMARYWSLSVGERTIAKCVWSYADPSAKFAPIKDHLAFYAPLMDACYVDEELIVAQPGGFYGGWITSDLVGPFKGEPGTEHW